jgi:hypothetical protein
MAGPGETVTPTAVAEVKGVTKVAGKLEGKVAFITGVTLPVDAGFTNKK